MQPSEPGPVRFRGSRLARAVLRLFGWRVVFPGFPGPQGVLLLYPHTSNWDFAVGILAKWTAGIPLSFWSKDALFGWPLFGPWLRWIGGIPVGRDAAGGRVRSTARRFAAARDEGRFFWLGVAPEGTRRRTEAWRSGFHHLASQAGVPIGCGYIDYGQRVIGVETFVVPSGDRDADMAAIAAAYAGVRGHHADAAAPIRLAP